MPLIRIQREFATEQEAEEYMQKLYNEYDPAGYGTMIKITVTADDKYVVVGWRASSCD